MKIYTNENNTNTLKLLIAAKLAGKHVDLVKTPLEAVLSAGPRRLPILTVDDQLSFFSSNAAVQYLFPVLDLSKNGQCEQQLEWEACRLAPAVSVVAGVSKAAGADAKQALQGLLLTLQQLLASCQYVTGAKLTAADIAIWSTLYPLYYNKDLKEQYLNASGNIVRWFEQIAAAKSIQEAVKQWGGSAAQPLGATAALGTPLLSTQHSPIGSPDEVETAVTPAELEAARDCWENGVSYLPKPLEQQKVVLPQKDLTNILITSALPYVNNVPHLGNIIGCVLSADMFARYSRACARNVLFVCGTDEYGTATETKALEEGLTPKEICDKYFAIHNAVYRWFDIGFDYFGRTSTPEQTKIAQEFFLKLNNNGFISTQSVDQLLCEKCDRFLADRFVEGTCPHPGCLYESARGDQCDKCGRLINATELIQPRCKVCGHPPVIKPSEQLFLELGQLEPSLRTWLSGAEAGWSAPARAVSRSWLREPLRARAITRDLKWGVQVPIPKYSNKVFYVWFDAPIGYLSITQCLTKDYEKWWKPDKEHKVKLYQFMAKDNVPFHAIMFPATLLGVNEGHQLVNHIFATEYLNYEEGKFSKSRGVGVFGTDAEDTGIPADVWRFYLASIRPETGDSSFSWTELITRNNSELLNNLGNFCHRSLSFCANCFGGELPAARPAPRDYELIARVNRDVAAYVQNMERGRLRDALRHVLAISRRGNQLMQAEQPWVLLKGNEDDKVRGGTVVALCCQLVALLCALLAPYTPNAARRLYLQLNTRPLTINPQKPSWIQYLPPGHVIGKPEPLFAKIDPARADQLRAQYAGTQAQRTQNGVNATVAEIEAAIAAQGDKVRKLKSSTKDKSVWQPEVDKLLELKKQLAAAQKSSSATQVRAQAAGGEGCDVAGLEKAIAEQGDKVRQLKATTKDKSVWQPEVNKLLELKKQLAAAQANPANSANSATHVQAGQDAASLEKAIAEQGDKVRQLKASTKDKSVWQPEVNKLLELKKQLAAAQANPANSANPANLATEVQAGQDAASLEKAIAEQGDKVRKLKASTKDKTVWQPEVDKLLQLKQQLATCRK